MYDFLHMTNFNSSFLTSFFFYLPERKKKKKVQIIIFKFQPAGNIIFLRSTKVIYTSKHKSMNSEVETSTTTLWRL